MNVRSNYLTHIKSNYKPLILIVGQSNADGRAPEDTLPDGVLDASHKLTDFKMWNKTNSTFQDYQLGVNTGADDNDDTKFAFDIFFANKFLSDYAGPLYAIKHTLTGTPISEKGSTHARWQPITELITSGEDSLCDELVTKFKLAMSYADTNNIKLFPIAILYHQGEGDATRGADGAVADYPANLSNLVMWYRGLFDNYLYRDKIPFINGTVISTVNSYSPIINSTFSDLNKLDYWMKTVDMSEHENSIGDGLHYNATALQYMGETMYSYLKTYMPYL